MLYWGLLRLVFLDIINGPIQIDRPHILHTYCIQVLRIMHGTLYENLTAWIDLRRRILSTELKPGHDLDEAGLSGYYNMSRTPLREVLQRLQGEGYVVMSENRGAKVASMDIDVLRTFFQTAPMVYANIARLACETPHKRAIGCSKTSSDRFRQGGKVI